MSIQTAYNEWSRTYDTDDNATRDLDASATRQVLGEMRFAEIIEMGCGTGKNTALFAKLGGRVRAFDFSEGMLARARERLGPLASVVFSVADIQQRWPVGDGAADLVSCNLILEHVRELPFVFAEAARALAPGGKFFISELHPFRQYQGTVANFRRDEQTTQIPAFVHHLSDFLQPAAPGGFRLLSLREWWHEKDAGKPPRLVSFLFQKEG